MDHRSPLESIFGIIGGLPQGHDKPVKHALYNAVALLLLFLCCAATWALFMILEPFVKPLIWALLVGSVLHPLKRSLRDKFQTWFESLEVSHTPIVLGVVLLPINIVNDLSDFIGDQLLKRIKFIISVCVAIPVILLIYNYTPKLVVTMVLIGYICLIFLMWKPENNTKFHYISIGIWLLLSCCLAHQFGTFQLPAFILLQVIFFGGFVSEVYDIHSELNAGGHSITFLESLSLAFHDKASDVDISEESEENKESIEQITENSEVTSSATSQEKLLEHIELFEPLKGWKVNDYTRTLQPIESAHFKENTLSHPNLSVKFCPVAYHLRSEMGAYVFISMIVIPLLSILTSLK
ncbi:hypothetical protein GEV33_010558 [Tenebrio molitor]|uniref:Uncharacterized protein n=1 Tax=Tenebrio molitor TaxID=7067 RepID=A0A8J6HCF4_TENMO|nr:hypothetical protein GEV33_010558 [Tenebrio molitor]